jgi:hypothetical protein
MHECMIAGIRWRHLCSSSIVAFDAIMGSKSDREVVQVNQRWRWRALCLSSVTSALDDDLDCHSIRTEHHVLESESVVMVRSPWG